MSIKMRFMRLLGVRGRSEGEKVVATVRYANATQLVSDMLCVERLHSPASRASDKDREESVGTSPILSLINGWSQDITVVILGGQEVGEEGIPEALLNDPELLHFDVNMRCWERRNEDRAARAVEDSGNKG